MGFAGVDRSVAHLINIPPAASLPSSIGAAAGVGVVIADHGTVAGDSENQSDQ